MLIIKLKDFELRIEEEKKDANIIVNRVEEA